MNVPYIVQAVLVTIISPFRKRYTANVCRHDTKKKGFIQTKGGTAVTIMEMPLAENGRPDYCLECIGKMSIRCAWCGEPIFIGSPITLYTPNGEFKVPYYATMYGDGEQQAFVGCLRWDCADTGADLSGYWIPPGVVKRVLSPFEVALQTSKAVVVGDTRNYPTSVSLHDIN